MPDPVAIVAPRHWWSAFHKYLVARPPINNCTALQRHRSSSTIRIGHPPLTAAGGVSFHSLPVSHSQQWQLRSIHQKMTPRVLGSLRTIIFGLNDGKFTSLSVSKYRWRRLLRIIIRYSTIPTIDSNATQPRTGPTMTPTRCALLEPGLELELE